MWASLVGPYWPKLAHLAQKTWIFIGFVWVPIALKGHIFKDLFWWARIAACTMYIPNVEYKGDAQKRHNHKWKQEIPTRIRPSICLCVLVLCILASLSSFTRKGHFYCKTDEDRRQWSDPGRLILIFVVRSMPRLASLQWLFCCLIILFDHPVMILFWFHFSGLSNRIIRKKYLFTGDWSQSSANRKLPFCLTRFTCFLLKMRAARKICAFGAYADSEGPDQTALKRSLIRAFAVCQNLWIDYNESMESKRPDETLCMRRMMWIRTFCTCPDTFSLDTTQMMIIIWVELMDTTQTVHNYTNIFSDARGVFGAIYIEFKWNSVRHQWYYSLYMR